MSDDNRLLGQIDGKLDMAIELLNRHIDDDVRRFSEVYGRLGTLDTEIATAKGAKAGVLWVAGGVATGLGIAVPYVVKVLGL